MPLTQQIHRDKALENVSIAFLPGEFIADRLIPKVPVKRDSDVYYIYDMNTLAIPETIRAPGTRANEADWNMSTGSYTLLEHALEHTIPDEDRGNADKPINLDIDATEIITNKILLRKEQDCALLCQTKTNWANYVSQSSDMAWNQNTTLSNPITQIDSATSKIIASSGKTPNVVAIDDGTFRGAKVHVSIVDRVKYTSADSITEQMLAKLFDVGEVLVGRAIYETAAELLTSSPGFIWTNTAFVAYVERSPGLKKPSAAYALTKAGAPYIVTKWREVEKNSDVVRVASKYQFKNVATGCAYQIIDTT